MTMHPKRQELCEALQAYLKTEVSKGSTERIKICRNGSTQMPSNWNSAFGTTDNQFLIEFPHTRTGDITTRNAAVVCDDAAVARYFKKISKLGVLEPLQDYHPDGESENKVGSVRSRNIGTNGYRDVGTSAWVYDYYAPKGKIQFTGGNPNDPRSCDLGFSYYALLNVPDDKVELLLNAVNTALEKKTPIKTVAVTDSSREGNVTENAGKESGKTFIN